MLMAEKTSIIAFGIAFVGGLGALEWHRILMMREHVDFQSDSRDMLRRIDDALAEMKREIDRR